MCLLTIQKGKIGWREYYHFLSIPLSFILLSGIVLLVDVSRQGLGWVDLPVSGLYLSITRESLRDTIEVSGKALTGITCLYMISLTTPLYEIMGVLRRLHVPQIMIELMYLIYRFIFVLLDFYHNMKIAAKSRMGYSNILRAYHSFFCICSNLLAVAFQNASKSFDAMESRCYDGELIFLETEKKITGTQMMMAFLYLALAAGILVLERLWVVWN